MRWTRFATLGFLMIAAGPILFLIASLIWDLDDPGFFVITGVIALLGAFLVSRFGAWSKVVGIVLAILLAGGLFWTFFGLFTPNSFFDFVPGILVVPGVLIALGSCIASLMSRRKDNAGAPSEREPKLIRAISTAVVVLAVLSAVLTFVGKKDVGDNSGASATVVLKNFEYDKAEYSFEPGSKVLVRNDDPFRHTFTIEALDIDVAMNPGSEQVVTIPDDATGEQIVFCRPHTSDPDKPTEDDMAAKVAF
jgi:plastocyanin